jgi:hypothetical protein
VQINVALGGTICEECTCRNREPDLLPRAPDMRHGVSKLARLADLDRHAYVGAQMLSSTSNKLRALARMLAPSVLSK